MAKMVYKRHLMFLHVLHFIHCKVVVYGPDLVLPRNYWHLHTHKVLSCLVFAYKEAVFIGIHAQPFPVCS